MKKAHPKQEGEGPDLFEFANRRLMPLVSTERFAPEADARASWGYPARLTSRKARQEDFLSAEYRNDEAIASRPVSGLSEDLILGLPENQVLATSQEVAEILGSLKGFLTDPTSHSH